jgi:hypothetical protein
MAMEKAYCGFIVGLDVIDDGVQMVLVNPEQHVVYLNVYT